MKEELKRLKLEEKVLALKMNTENAFNIYNIDPTGMHLHLHIRICIMILL